MKKVTKRWLVLCIHAIQFDMPSLHETVWYYKLGCGVLGAHTLPQNAWSEILSVYSWYWCEASGLLHDTHQTWFIHFQKNHEWGVELPHEFAILEGSQFDGMVWSNGCRCPMVDIIDKPHQHWFKLVFQSHGWWSELFGEVEILWESQFGQV